MKNIACKIFGLLFVILLWSCEKDTENVSRITNFPTFDFKGSAVIFQTLGTSYVDLGCTASEAGQDLPVTVAVVGESTGYKGTVVKTDVVDKYIITYSATNSDGFPGTRTRVVYVAKTGNLIASIEGVYSSTVLRNGVGGAAYTDMKYMIISKNSAGGFVLPCGIGGYYALGRNYGPGYLAPVTITANNITANNFSFGPCEVGTFGDAVTIDSFIVDAAAKTITVNSAWSGYTFVFTLKQVQF